jgi:hypothetical protein
MTTSPAFPNFTRDRLITLMMPSLNETRPSWKTSLRIRAPSVTHSSGGSRPWKGRGHLAEMGRSKSNRSVHFSDVGPRSEGLIHAIARPWLRFHLLSIDGTGQDQIRGGDPELPDGRAAISAEIQAKVGTSVQDRQTGCHTRRDPCRCGRR